MGVRTVLSVENEHQKLTNAGWGYRMNERGWVIYHHPLNGRWHTLQEAMVLLEAGRLFRVRVTPDTLIPSS